MLVQRRSRFPRHLRPTSLSYRSQADGERWPLTLRRRSGGWRSWFGTRGREVLYPFFWRGFIWAGLTSFGVQFRLARRPSSCAILSSCPLSWKDAARWWSPLMYITSFSYHFVGCCVPIHRKDLKLFTALSTPFWTQPFLTVDSL